MPEEIMTAVTKPEAVAMAEIHAMRGLTDAVGGLVRQVEKLGEKVDDVRERVIALEAREYERKIEDLEGRLSAALLRIDNLESTRDQQRGARALVDWLRTTAPWLVATALGVAAAAGWKDKIG